MTEAALAASAAITIDVDSLRFYREIHGLPGRDDDIDPIYEVAMPRFWALIEAARVPATLFLVGADAPRYARVFRPAGALRAEIASHSFAHDYRLTQQTPEAISADLARADAALRPLAPDGAIVGFRAPGYNTSGALLRAVAALGYRYDSSLLPAPLYYGARAVMIGLYGALGRPSRSLRGDPRAFAGPLEPYRADLDRPWRRAAAGLLEIPIACEPHTRTPLFGTSWVVAPARLREAGLRAALGHLSMFNFEMHAIDLLDATDPGVEPELARAQRDLQVPVRDKVRALEGLFSTLAAERAVTTLASFVPTVLFG